MKKIRILLVGNTGRLGSLVEKQFQDDPTLEITARLNSKNLKSASTLFKTSNLGQMPFDAVLDVSVPKASQAVLKHLLKSEFRIPYIIGCTGWTDSQFKTIESYAKKATVVVAPNFSPAVNLFLQMLSDYAPSLKRWGFKPVISEIHHDKKRDTPSGTAKALLVRLNQNSKTNSIPVHSTRAGNIVGTHTVEFFSPTDVFSLKHEALDRTLFAQGAAMAVKWATKAHRTSSKSKVYSMSDVLFG